MPVKLSIAQQRAIVKAIPAGKKAQLKAKCRKCEQAGEGFFDIFKKAGAWLGKTIGPIAKSIGPTVLKELVYPLLRKKVGLGLRSAGGGLRTPGRGAAKKKPAAKKKKPAMKRKR